MFKALLVAVGALGTLAITPCAAGQASSAGYEVLRVTDEVRNRPIHLDIWYPTTLQQEQAQSYGFGAGRVAQGARLTGDKLPIVLLSHGAFGAASNYSWLAEHLARLGYVVLGVSHFGESPVFGSDSIDPAAVRRFHDRTLDLEFALSFLIQRSSYAAQLDPTRLAVVGHSSGGASALMLAGAVLSPVDLATHCSSEAGALDKGCQYSGAGAADSARTLPVPSSRRLRALVVFDPAVGPGLTDRSLRTIQVPTLVVGAVQNDFLPFAAHAGRVSALMPDAKLVKLDRGEGHFVFLDECTLPLEAQGVKLCSDRQGVDRSVVHDALRRVVAEFLSEHL